MKLIQLKWNKRYFKTGTTGSLTDEEHTIAVNPEHVTLIEPTVIPSQERLPALKGCTLWVKADSGCQTKDFFIPKSVEEVTAILNQD